MKQCMILLASLALSISAFAETPQLELKPQNPTITAKQAQYNKEKNEQFKRNMALKKFERKQFMQSLTASQRKAYMEKMKTMQAEWQNLSATDRASFQLVIMEQKAKWLSLSEQQRKNIITQLKSELSPSDQKL